MSADIVVSLDFELRWGVQDKLGDDFAAYRKNLEGVREAVPAMLEVFERRGVRATWAIVGAIACEGWDEWEACAPAWPRYMDPSLRWNAAYRRGEPQLYFAPDLVERVRRTKGQELGSHTFSHVYMGEPGFVRRDAEGDADAVASLFRRKWNATATSFVFPRNQVAFVDVLCAHGVEVVRDNPAAAYWALTTAAQASAVVRLVRLADALFPLGRRSFRPEDGRHRASHFVRFGLPTFAWKTHVHRLAGEARSLRDGEVLHLWWHPHNLGGDVARSIGRLMELLEMLETSAPHARFASMVDVARRGSSSAARS